LRRARISLRSRPKPGDPNEAPEQAAPAQEPAGLVAVGEFGRAQGLQGEVRLKSFTAIPEAIMDYGPLRDRRGQTYRLIAVRPLEGDMLVARVEGISTREAAEMLARRSLFIPRAVLPDAAALGDDEYHHADLIGLKAITPDGAELGQVQASRIMARAIF
jgi:16S rRNA processing protein RimM